eukprot:305095-Ditylum_brightwellii.AAC.1
MSQWYDVATTEFQDSMLNSMPLDCVVGSIMNDIRGRVKTNDERMKMVRHTKKVALVCSGINQDRYEEKERTIIRKDLEENEKFSNCKINAEKVEEARIQRL